MPKILVHDGPQQTREFEIGSSLVIGRGVDADVALSGLDVSPRHARIWKTRAGCFIRDLHSRHGTFVNGKRVIQSALKDGACIEIGGRKITYRERGQPAEAPAPPAIQAVREASPPWRSDTAKPPLPLAIVASRDSLDPLLFVGPSAFQRENEAQRLRERLRALREIGHQAATAPNLDAFLERILNLQAEALPQAQHGMIALLNAATDRLEVRKFVGLSGEGAGPAGLHEALAAHALTTRRAELSDQTPNAVPPQAAPRPPAQDPRGSVICAPLISPAKNKAETAIGVIQWCARPETKFSQDDLDFVAGCAVMAAAGIETTRLCDELRDARRELSLEYRRLSSHQSHLEAENVVLRQELNRTHPFDAIISTSPRMKESIALAQKIKDSNAGVLITGESGTGKEMFAKAIHYNSVRALKPFVALNCAAVPDALMETELFGIEKGVATGVESRIGKLEAAHGGTFFLDEVGDMPPTTQAKLLRALQEREFTRVGGHAPVKVDIRIIAATNKNLREAIAKSEFREELYYRLNVIEIHLPPLRERKEDILPLAHHFLKMFAQETGKAVYAFSRDAEELLLAHAWPGNVRELKNVVHRCVVLADQDGLVDHRSLSPEITGMPPDAQGGSARGKLDVLLASIERRMIKEALPAAAGNKTKAAALLDISREGLRLKLAKHGLA